MPDRLLISFTYGLIIWIASLWLARLAARHDSRRLTSSLSLLGGLYGSVLMGFPVTILVGLFPSLTISGLLISCLGMGIVACFPFWSADRLNRRLYPIFVVQSESAPTNYSASLHSPGPIRTKAP